MSALWIISQCVLIYCIVRAIHEHRKTRRAYDVIWNERCDFMLQVRDSEAVLEAAYEMTGLECSPTEYRETSERFERALVAYKAKWKR